jgi:N-acetylglucosaminyldiphosphoundecaprenol N-acetyl-beta-D-mannosaminyltransferase
MMNGGLEWLYRLVMEPGRLWQRYLINNPAFVILFGWQLLKTYVSAWIRPSSQ